jgi:hypothetical protein
MTAPSRVTLVLLPGLDGTSVFFRPLLAALPSWVELHRCQATVFYLASSRDVLVPRSNADDIVRQKPSTSVVVIDGPHMALYYESARRRRRDLSRGVELDLFRAELASPEMTEGQRCRDIVDSSRGA